MEIRSDIDREISRLSIHLEALSNGKVQRAAAFTLNGAAMASRRGAIRNIKDNFTLRRKSFNIKSMQTNLLDLNASENMRMSQIETRSGSVQEYWAQQELGATLHKKSNIGRPIPTSYAAGQGYSANRTKTVRRSNHHRRMQVGRYRGRAHNKKQEMILSIRHAMEQNKKFVYLELPNDTKGIFHIKGGFNRALATPRGWPRGINIKMVWDLSRDKVTIKSNPWLLPTENDAVSVIPIRFRDELLRQIDRQTRGMR